MQQTILTTEASYGATDRKPRILLVEDSESIMLAIHDFLVPHFEVVTADSAEEALQATGRQHFDLLITDINLPGNSGFDLFRRMKASDPNLKIILITAYDINSYIHLISDLGIDQVISKHSNLSLADIFVAATKTISGDIFGVKKYFPDLRVLFPSEKSDSNELINRELRSLTIRDSNEREMAIDSVSRLLFEYGKIPESLSKLVLDEITTNAMIRAPRNADGSYKYQKVIAEKDMLIPNENIRLAPEDYFILQYGFYDQWMILVCIDPHGSLTKEEVLYRLKRHINLNPGTGLPEGLTDSHGRGIFLLREHLSHLIFNIHRKRKTEVICLYNRISDAPYKNISIYEITD